MYEMKNIYLIEETLKESTISEITAILSNKTKKSIVVNGNKIEDILRHKPKYTIITEIIDEHNIKGVMELIDVGESIIAFTHKTRDEIIEIYAEVVNINISIIEKYLKHVIHETILNNSNIVQTIEKEII